MISIVPPTPVPAPNAIGAPVFAIAATTVIVYTPVKVRIPQVASAVVPMKPLRACASLSAFYGIPPLPCVPAFTLVLALQSNHFQLPAPFFSLMPIQPLIGQDLKLVCLDGLVI